MEDVNNMKSVKTSSAEYLFKVNPNVTKLDAEKAYVFPITIAKELFIFKR